jgi:hypothetical protein
MAQEYGWICPRCGKSLAPWVRECDCLAAAGDPLMPVPGDPLPWVGISFEDEPSLSAVLRKVRQYEQDAKKVTV